MHDSYIEFTILAFQEDGQNEVIDVAVSVGLSHHASEINFDWETLFKK